MSRKVEGPCVADGCAKPPHARGFCPMHYQRWRHGEVIPHTAYRLPGEGLWDMAVEDGTGCWLWTGRTLNGYPIFGGRLGHRLAYEAMIVEIPPGLELDHLCFTPLCINPWHLEPVTKQVNMRRRFDRITVCKNGHPFTPENTIDRGNGHRGCRECDRITSRAYYWRKKQAG